jgi:hypothetical protein
VAELKRGASEARRADSSKLSARGRSPDASAPAPVAVPVRVRRPDDLPGRQREVLGALLDWPELLQRPEAQRLVTLLTDPDLQAIFHVTARIVEQQRGIDAPALLEELAGNPARAWLGERLSGAPKYDRERAEGVLIEGLPFLERDRKKGELEQLRREIQAARERGDSAHAEELTRRHDKLART